MTGRDHVSDTPRLSAVQGFALALAATAPWYSIMVTAPLIAALVGSGTALVYLLAAVPAIGVARGMNANDRRDPDKGTVYTWVRRRFPRTGWFAGFCLAATGIIATSGMAYVAADLLAPAAPAWARVGLAALLTAVATAIDVGSIRAMAVLQYLAAVTGAAATLTCLMMVMDGSVILRPTIGSPLDWFHGVLLAVFAYWGFDAIYALTEQAETGAPQRVAVSTMIALMVFFTVGGTACSAADASPVVSNPVVRIAVVTSAVMSLGSTLVPTARGVEAMAEAGEVPSWAAILSEARWSTLAVATVSVFWSGLLLVSEGLFNDTIEALSVLVGVYFTVSSLIAALHAASVRERAEQWASVVLMGVITLSVTAQMFTVGYGDTSLAGVGGAGLIVAGLCLVGAIAALACTRRRTRADDTRGSAPDEEGCRARRRAGRHD